MIIQTLSQVLFFRRNVSLFFIFYPLLVFLQDRYKSTKFFRLQFCLYSSIGYLVGDLFFLTIYMKKPKLIRWSYILISQLFVVQYIKAEENYSIIASVFMIGFLLINSFYKNAQAGRSKFLLTLIEDQWDQILFNTISQPSIIFSFDLIQNCFLLKKSFNFPFQCQTTEELKQFLRITRIAKNESVTLEKYIHTKLHSLQKITDHLINQELLVQQNRTDQEIKYSIFPGASPIIIIQFLSNLQLNKKLHIENLYQYKYLTLLKSMQITFKNIYKRKQKNCIQIVKLFVYRDLLERSKKLNLIEKFNLKKMMKKLLALYRDYDIEIMTQKALLILILIEAFESSISESKEKILVFNIESQFTQKTLENFRLHSLHLANSFIKIQTEQERISFQVISDIRDISGIDQTFRNQE